MSIPIQTYGSDRAGRVCGCLFARGRAGPTVGSPKALAWLSLQHNENGFWILVGIVAVFTLPAVWLVFLRLRD